MNFTELTQVAMLGTERQGLPGVGEATPLDRLQSQLDANQRERALLSMAVLSATHEKIGILPATDIARMPAPCPAERLPYVSDRAGTLLQRLLSGEFAESMPEWLALAANAGQIAPPEALPALLELGTKKTEHREKIAPVVGERGRWLAAQHQPWAWLNGAAADEENIWQTGEPAARLFFLHKLRRTDAARARELLVSSWSREAPDERAVFITVLEAGLAPDDEPFLEAALDDKRKEVRRAAATLLARLPDSALIKRMVTSVKPLLKYAPAPASKSRKPKAGTIEVTLPAECDKAMQRDGIEPKPQQGIGEKAWWLIQLLEATPLDIWTSECQVAPAQIIAASMNGEWKTELFEAWTRAAAHQRHAAWAEALFESALENQRFDKAENLLRAMSVPQREARMTALLENDDKKARPFLGALLARCEHDWTPEFSRAALAWMREQTSDESGDWQVRTQFKTFALRLPPAVLAEAATGWPTDSKGWEFWSKGVDEFLSLAQFRADLHAAFTHQP